MTDIQKGTKVYALFVSRGSYDDYSSWTESIFLNKEDAEEARVAFDKEHIPNEADMPMTQEEWSNLDYGYGEGGNTIEEKGGYTVADFEKMNAIMDLIWEHYNPSKIHEFELK
ncbi:MAG: hypothetical protein QM660_10725 [Dysgonomonas sp.]